MSATPFDDVQYEKRVDSPVAEARSMFQREDDGDGLLIVKRLKPHVMSVAEQKMEAWRKIFTAMGAQDEHLIESWKSEMDNLLIFAALYSAVVSAFVVDSFGLISSDAPKTGTTTSLAEISSRIASFQITSNFINSTRVLADASPDTTNSPPDYAVKVNTLWFFSLTLSLIAAFFAIAIQQWLRHLRIPKHIPLREAIRLRQLRYRGIMRWQVPVIVTILPALVQISVILFLIGLIEYVRHSNRDVALPFTVVSSISLVLFVLVSLFPLIEPSCPYKSPLVHIIWNLSWLVAAVTTVIITLPISLLVDCFATKKHATLSRWANNINSFSTGYLLALQPPTTETSHFWTSRETDRAESKNLKHLLDQEALSWAPTAGPSIMDIRCCLSDLAPQRRTRCVMEWISLKHDGHTDMSRMLSKGTLSEKALDKVNTHFSQEFRGLLMEVLTSPDWPEKTQQADDKERKKGKVWRSEDLDIPYVAMFLWRILDAETNAKDKETPMDRGALDDFRREFIRELFYVCCERTPDQDHDQSLLGWKATARILPVLFFDILDAEKDDILFGAEDIVKALKWADTTAGILCDAQQAWTTAAPIFWFAPHEHLLSCCAIVLSLLATHQPHTPEIKEKYQTHLKNILQYLDGFLTTGRGTIQLMLDGRYERLNDTESNTLPIIVKRAVPAIAENLARLRESKVLPLASNDCPSDAVQVKMKDIYAVILVREDEKSRPVREGTIEEGKGTGITALPSLTKEGTSDAEGSSQ